MISPSSRHRRALDRGFRPAEFEDGSKSKTGQNRQRGAGFEEVQRIGSILLIRENRRCRAEKKPISDDAGRRSRKMEHYNCKWPEIPELKHKIEDESRQVSRIRF